MQKSAWSDTTVEHKRRLPGPPPAGRLPTILALIALGALAVLAYVNSLPGIFVQDDLLIIQGNPLVREFDFSLRSVAAIFRTDYWGNEMNSGLFRPLTVLSLALNHFLNGMNPLGYHLFNLLLHAGVVVLCYLTLRRWEVGFETAWLAAALFAVHPLHTEVVNIAIGRSELLAALFLLSALYLARERGALADVGGLLCFLLAALAKEHAIVLLALLPLLEAFRCRSCKIWWQRWRLYGGLLLTTAGWLAWRTYGVVRTLAPAIPDPDFVPLAYVSWDERLFAALKLQWLYLAKLCVPVRLQLSYLGASFPKMISNPLSGEALLLLLSVAGVLVLCVLGWRRNNRLALFASMYLVAFLPTSNLLFPIGVGFAERLAYFPSVWFCAGLAVVLHDCSKQAGWQRVGWWAGLCLVGVLAFLTVKRNQAYSSELLLWQTETGTDATDPVAWLMTADILRNSGQAAASEQAYMEMLKVRPDFAVGLASLAFHYLVTERPSLAITAAKRSLELRAGIEDSKTRQDRGLVAEGYFLLGDYAEALAWLDKGAAFTGSPQRPHEMRGFALENLGRYAEAAAAYRQIPTEVANPEVLVHLGICLLRMGRFAEAEQVLETAYLERGVDSAPLWNTLGTARAEQGQWVKARDAFERAVSLAPGNPYYRQNLQRARIEFERALQD